jgi:hypothetical protein
MGKTESWCHKHLSAISTGGRHATLQGTMMQTYRSLAAVPASKWLQKAALLRKGLRLA